jgi:hypothetical protein
MMSRPKQLVFLAVILAAGVAAGFIVGQGYANAHRNEQKRQCDRNLKRIDSLLASAAHGDQGLSSEITTILRDIGETNCRCPAGGVYWIGETGQPTLCTFHHGEMVGNAGRFWVGRTQLLEGR